jgi:hypothetical protein
MHTEILDFIKKLTPTKGEVMGTSGGLQEIKKHSFLRGFDWRKLKMKKLTSPIDTDINISFCSSSQLTSSRSVRKLDETVIKKTSTYYYPNIEHLDLQLETSKCAKMYNTPFFPQNDKSNMKIHYD